MRYLSFIKNSVANRILLWNFPLVLSAVIYFGQRKMWKLINPIQPYCWGSKTALTRLFGIENPTNQPMAELWMGAHPQGSSQLNINGETLTLERFIQREPEQLLGRPLSREAASLPFLFKVLCAEQALSIQVHPDKAAAEQGFREETQRGIPLDAAERNYKDDNHKPELLYALTPFQGMNGFRPLAEIAALLAPFAATAAPFHTFITSPDEVQLRQLLGWLLTLSHQPLQQVLKQLEHLSQASQQPPWPTVRTLLADFPGDIGAIMPLLLNLIALQPGEAMFLSPGTPHAYLQGCGLEIMANSDNVLRAGLTCKHIDSQQLLAHTRFTSLRQNEWRVRPCIVDGEVRFPVPVDDFSLAILSLGNSGHHLQQSGPLILFCIKGKAICQSGRTILRLLPGQSLFVAAADRPVTVYGHGEIAIAGGGTDNFKTRVSSQN